MLQSVWFNHNNVHKISSTKINLHLKREKYMTDFLVACQKLHDAPRSSFVNDTDGHTLKVRKYEKGL